MSTVIGIDVARFSNVAATQERSDRPFTFSNTPTGYRSFLSWAETNGAQVFGMEPTGHYYKPLAAFLKQHGKEVYLVSCEASKSANSIYNRSRLKTDAVDARSIAKIASDPDARIEYREVDPFFTDLRRLNELHYRISAEKQAILVRIHNELDLTWPELRGLVKPKNKGSLLILEKWPHPDMVLSQSKEDFMAEARTIKPRIPDAKIEAIYEAAVRQKDLQTTGRGEILSLAQLAIVMKGQICELEKQMEAKVLSTETGALLLSIPSIGPTTASILLAELGDLRNYQNKNQVLKMAGLNMITKSSGKKEGRPHISREGRTKARTALYRAAITASRPTSPYLDYYRAKGGGRKAFVACSRKLLRIAFAVVSSGQPFCAERLRSG